MTSAQLEGLVRSVMLIGAGFALKYGIDAATWTSITAGVVALVTAGWSLYSNSTSAMVGQVAKSDDVKQVVMSSAALSDAQPSAKVISHEQ